jgi:hypothetical protein
VACSDSDNPDRVDAWRRAAAAADRAAPYFGRYWTWFSSICQPWPGRDPDRYAGPWTRQTVNPVLVVGNRFDPATPYRGAVTLARLLPRSRLLTLDGWGHASEGKSSCIDAHTAAICSPPDAATRHRLPARHRAIRPPIDPEDGRQSNQGREKLTMRRASPALLTSAPAAAVALVAGTATL